MLKVLYQFNGFDGDLILSDLLAEILHVLMNTNVMSTCMKDKKGFKSCKTQEDLMFLINLQPAESFNLCTNKYQCINIVVKSTTTDKI